MADRKSWQSVIGLLLGDWLALGLFVFVGQVEHDLLSQRALLGFLAVTAELALPWTVIALVMGALDVRPGDGLVGFLRRSLNAWFIAAPAALVLRSLLRDQATIVVAFLLVTVGFGGAFLLGWRLIYYLMWRRPGVRTMVEDTP